MFFTEQRKEEVWKVLRVIVYGGLSLLVVLLLKKFGVDMSEHLSMIAVVLINALLVGLKQPFNKE